MLGLSLRNPLPKQQSILNNAYRLYEKRYFSLEQVKYK